MRKKILLGSILLIGCTENPMEKNIQGKWLISDYRVNVNNPTFEQERLQEEIEKMKKNSYFIFKSDYEYEVHLNGNKEYGKWKINPEARELYTQKLNDSIEFVLKIDTLNAQKLVFSSSKDGIKTQVSLVKEITR